MHSGKEQKFAVVYVVGDRVEVLRVFPMEDREAAVGYAQKTAKNYEKGLVSVDMALFEPGTEKRAKGAWRMYEAFCCGA